MSRDWYPDDHERNPGDDSLGRGRAERERPQNPDLPDPPVDRNRSSKPDEAERISADDSRRTYYFRDRAYVLRESGFATLAEVGKFRVIETRDLAEFAYRNNDVQTARDLRQLEQHGLLARRTIGQESRQPRHVVTLTRKGKQFLLASGRIPEGQALYHGLVKPRELKHDAALYRLYQRELNRISQRGGHAGRVVLDYELKRRIHRDLARLEQQPPTSEARREIAERHGLVVLGNKIQVPDLRLEYETADHERKQIDLELATRNYRPQALAQKAKAGFSLYAPREDASKLRRVLDEAELTARILAL